MGNPLESPKPPIKVEVVWVDEISPVMPPIPLDESDIMLDAWVELPAPSGGIVIRARPAELPPPDLPDIPQDWEDE
jgi:hypothetical protein